MEMEIAPIEGDLQRVMEIGDSAGLCDQQAPPDQRADLAQHHPQLIEHTWLRSSAHAARFLRCRRGQPMPRPAPYAVRGRSGKVRYKSSRYSNWHGQANGPIHADRRNWRPNSGRQTYGAECARNCRPLDWQAAGGGPWSIEKSD